MKTVIVHVHDAEESNLPRYDSISRVTKSGIRALISAINRYDDMAGEIAKNGGTRAGDNLNHMAGTLHQIDDDISKMISMLNGHMRG